MSIYNAMQSGVSGLFANAQKVTKISDNIANSNTVGYKRSFTDFVTATSNANTLSEIGRTSAGVRAVMKSAIDVQGNIMTTNVATDLAITGDGFFMVGKNATQNDGTQFTLTRAGSFRPDENGFLQNSSGYFLQGWRYDESGNLPVVDRNGFSNLEGINVKNIEMVGDATTYMTISGNLPADEADGTNPLPGEIQPFKSSAEFFSPLGVSDRITYEWYPNSNDATGTPAGTSNQWSLRMRNSNGEDLGMIRVDFNDSGANAGSPASWNAMSAAEISQWEIDTGETYTPAGGANAYTVGADGIIALTIDNGSVPQTINLELGAPGGLQGITQFAGDYTPTQIEKDGAQTGSLSTVEINEEGILYGVFNNGARKALYQIPLGTVTNVNGLLEQDGNTYRLTQEAGAFSMVDANRGAHGRMISGALERSTVDIAEELTHLIETQRAYSSNAKIITTADEMLEETTRIKR